MQKSPQNPRGFIKNGYRKAPNALYHAYFKGAFAGNKMNAKEDTDMTQEERREYLIRYLLKEAGISNVKPPEDERESRALLRALLNVRLPNEATSEFLSVQDEYLKEEIRRKGIVDYRKTRKVGPNTYLYRGDITLLRVDSIVNAANSAMLGCFVPGHHCIDNAIHTYSGIQLRLECARQMEEQGHGEATGLSRVTPAYNLPSNHVIHTVGPIIQGIPGENDCRLLASCYVSCLDAALRIGEKSIAFCAISTGEFAFPKREAAKIAVSTVSKWMKDHPEADIDVVYDVFSEEDEAIYLSLLDN